MYALQKGLAEQIRLSLLGSQEPTGNAARVGTGLNTLLVHLPVITVRRQDSLAPIGVKEQHLVDHRVDALALQGDHQVTELAEAVAHFLVPPAETGVHEFGGNTHCVEIQIHFLAIAGFGMNDEPKTANDLLEFKEGVHPGDSDNLPFDAFIH